VSLSVSKIITVVFTYQVDICPSGSALVREDICFLPCS